MTPLLCSQVNVSELSLHPLSDGRFRALTMPEGMPLVVQGPISIIFERQPEALKLVVEEGDVLHKLVTAVEAEVASHVGVEVTSLIEPIVEMRGAFCVSAALQHRADGALGTTVYDSSGDVDTISCVRKGLVGVPMLWFQGVNMDSQKKSGHIVCSVCAWHQRG